MVITSNSYAIPYVIVLIILCFLSTKERKEDSKVRLIAFGVLLFFIGLRGFIYSDWISYYYFFDNLPILTELQYNSLYSDGYEFGFVLYSSIIKTICSNYFFWVFVNTLIDLLVFYWFFKRYSNSVIMSFILFVAFMGLSIEFNLYRNAKAMCLFLLSIPYLKERKSLPYFLLNLGGCLFHLSAFLFLPLYFVLHKRIPKIVVWTTFFIVNILLFCHISITADLLTLLSPLLGIEAMSDKLTHYLIQGETYGLSFGYIERTFTFIIFALLYNRMAARDFNHIVFYNCYFLYYILFNLFIDVKVFADRIPLLFVFSYWILYPNMLSTIYNKHNKLIMTILLFLLCFAKVVTSNKNIMAMYDNVLWGVLPIEQRRDIFEYSINELL